MVNMGELAQTKNYKGYLVRVWRGSATSPWRASAHDAKSGVQHHFARLEDLFSFLHQESTEHQAVESQEVQDEMQS